MEHKDHNVMAHTGITDIEYLELLDGPAELAGTPEINDWIIDAVYEQNIIADTEANIVDGMQAEKARTAAMKSAEMGRTTARSMLAKTLKERGY